MKLVDLLSGYADADWGNSSSRWLTSSIVMLYNKSLIMWKSKMQKTTAHSTAEAKYIGGWLRGLVSHRLHSLRFTQKRPTPMYEDNTACIECDNNVISGRERAKHINIRKHFAHEVIQNSQMLLVKVPTASQMANILTKGLHLPQVLACVDGLLHQRSTSST